MILPGILPVIVPLALGLTMRYAYPEPWETAYQAGTVKMVGKKNTITVTQELKTAGAAQTDGHDRAIRPRHQDFHPPRFEVIGAIATLALADEDVAGGEASSRLHLLHRSAPQPFFFSRIPCTEYIGNTS
jgi:hypothetical protein